MGGSTRDLKVGDLLQSPEGKPYPIDRIEMKNNSTPVYNFGVEGVHNYFVTESEIWTHNFIVPVVRAVIQGVAKYVAKSTAKSAVKNTGKSTSAGKVSRGTGNAKKPSLPDSFWKKDAPKNSTPGNKITHYKYNERTGKVEKSTVIYDRYGRQQYRVDHSNHGYSDHSNPHLHETLYGPKYDPKYGYEKRYNFW